MSQGEDEDDYLGMVGLSNLISQKDPIPSPDEAVMIASMDWLLSGDHQSPAKRIHQLRSCSSSNHTAQK